MLGLERVLSEKPPHLKSGTELRRHQVDALAGMLTELIAAAQRQPEVVADEADEEYEDEEDENGENGENGDHAEHELEELEHGRRALAARATRARSAATASAIRPRPARRSPPPASSRPRARSAS